MYVRHGIHLGGLSPQCQRSFKPLTITPQMQKVLDYLVHYGQMSDEDLQELLNIKRTRAYLLTKQMNEQGLISIVGRGVNKRYKLK